MVIIEWHQIVDSILYVKDLWPMHVSHFKILKLFVCLLL